MNPIKIYHNPKCSTSRTILKTLQDNGFQTEIIEYLKVPFKKQDLTDLLTLLKLKPSELLCKKESLAKELGLTDQNTNENEILDAMTEHPVLVERPILVLKNKAAIARPMNDFVELIKKGKLFK